MKIKQMDQDFDLVMIAEDFESSLVLLSDVLCWPLANMTSLKLNARKKSKVQNLSTKVRDNLKDWLWADQMLYDYFKGKLDQKKTKLGAEQLSERISRLAKLNTDLREACVVAEVNNTKMLAQEFLPYSKDVLGFQIAPEKPF